MDWLSEAWVRYTSSDELVAVTLSLAVPAIFLIFNRWWSRPKLRHGWLHDIVLLPTRPDGSPGVWRVQRFQVSNPGRQAIEDVEITFNWKPPHIEQYPHLANNEVIKGDNRYIVHIPRLNSREHINLSLASDGPELPGVIYVRGKGVVSKPVEFRTLLWLRLPLRIFVFVIMGLGFFTFVYLLVLVLGWVFFGRVPG